MCAIYPVLSCKAMLKTQFGFDSTSNDSWIAVVARPHWLLNWPIGVISVLHQQQQCVWQIKQAYYPLRSTCSTMWLRRWQSQTYSSQRLKITNSLCSRSTPERVSTGDFSRMTNNCTIPDWWHNTADPPTLVNYVWTTNTIYSRYQWQRSTPCFIKSGPLCIFAITFSNVDRFEWKLHHCIR